jgi:hypothetical protein
MDAYGACPAGRGGRPAPSRQGMVPLLPGAMPAQRCRGGQRGDPAAHVAALVCAGRALGAPWGIERAPGIAPCTFRPPVTQSAGRGPKTDARLLTPRRRASVRHGTAGALQRTQQGRGPGRGNRQRARAPAAPAAARWHAAPAAPAPSPALPGLGHTATRPAAWRGRALGAAGQLRAPPRGGGRADGPAGAGPAGPPAPAPAARPLPAPAPAAAAAAAAASGGRAGPAQLRGGRAHRETHEDAAQQAGGFFCGGAGGEGAPVLAVQHPPPSAAASLAPATAVAWRFSPQHAAGTAGGVLLQVAAPWPGV